MKNILQQIKNSIVFIGKVENGTPVVVGTGFLMQIDTVFHLVTAKHVIEGQLHNLGAFMNARQLSQMSYKSFADSYNQGLQRIRHSNPTVDIALIPYPINKNDNGVFIPDDMLIDNLDDLVELSDIFYCSFQPNINDLQKEGSINPIYRKGFVSRKNYDGTFYIDSSAFPGNSGSPIFNYPNGIEITENGITIGNNKPIKLLGIMSSYIPYQDIAVSVQTQKPRVIFEENTGISSVCSSHHIKEIMKQNDFQTQLNKLKQSTIPQQIQE